MMKQLKTAPRAGGAFLVLIFLSTLLLGQEQSDGTMAVRGTLDKKTQTIRLESIEREPARAKP
jgi:hypothetical protein